MRGLRKCDTLKSHGSKQFSYSHGNIKLVLLSDKSSFTCQNLCPRKKNDRSGILLKYI